MNKKSKGISAMDTSQNIKIQGIKKILNKEMLRDNEKRRKIYSEIIKPSIFCSHTERKIIRNAPSRLLRKKHKKKRIYEN